MAPPRSSIGSLAVLSLLVTGLACGPSQSEVDRIIDAGAPVIQAIRSFEDAEGHPPSDLADLVPRYLPNVPTTGAARFPIFLYTPSNVDADGWSLSVRLESFGFKHMCFRSPGQHGGPVRELRDGWAMVTP